MKKPSLNMNSLQEFLVGNVEKFAAGIALLLFAMLAYGAVGREKLDWGPPKLEETADQADNAIDTNKPELTIDITNIRDFSKDAEKMLKPVPVTDLGFPYPWVRGGEAWSKRTQPTLYALEGLRCGTGYGSIRMQGGVQGKRWIVLTGLLPVNKQRQAYLQAFSSVMLRTEYDNAPRYWFCQIERSAEEPSAAGNQPNWLPMDVNNYYAVTKQYSGVSKELAGPQFLARPYSQEFLMAFPLPPVENRTFGSEVVHAPEIPVYAPSAQPISLPMPGMPAPTAPKPPGAGLPPVAGAGGASDESSDESSDENPSEEESGPSPPTVAVQQVDYQLFRFFDFDALPGKQYRYRVKLMLRNPNYGLEPRVLEKSELAKTEWLEADWSQPSSPVVVPPDSRSLLASVRPASYTWSEPSGRLLEIQFEPITGVEDSAEFSVNRGTVANFPQVERNVVSGVLPTQTAPEPPPEPTTGRPNRRTTERKPPPKKPPEKIDFVTEMTVLDIRGGGRLLISGKDRTHTEPGAMLLLDASGNLIVRDELADQDEYMAYKPPEKKPEEETQPSSEDSTSEDSPIE